MSSKGVLTQQWPQFSIETEEQQNEKNGPKPGQKGMLPAPKKGIGQRRTAFPLLVKWKLE